MVRLIYGRSMTCRLVASRAPNAPCALTSNLDPPDECSNSEAKRQRFTPLTCRPRGFGAGRDVDQRLSKLAAPPGRAGQATSLATTPMTMDEALTAMMIKTLTTEKNLTPRTAIGAITMRNSARTIHLSLPPPHPTSPRPRLLNRPTEGRELTAGEKTAARQSPYIQKAPNGADLHFSRPL